MNIYYRPDNEKNNINGLDDNISQPGTIYTLNKFLWHRFRDRENEIEKYFAANIYFNKDFNDNHKYNYIRENLWKKKNVLTVEE